MTKTQQLLCNLTEQSQQIGKELLSQGALIQRRSQATAPIRRIVCFLRGYQLERLISSQGQQYWGVVLQKSGSLEIIAYVPWGDRCDESYGIIFEAISNAVGEIDCNHVRLPKKAIAPLTPPETNIENLRRFLWS